MRILSVFFITWKLINLLYLLTYLSIYGSWTILTSLMTEVAAMKKVWVKFVVVIMAVVKICFSLVVVIVVNRPVNIFAG